jgi:hypothetical protein
MTTDRDLDRQLAGWLDERATSVTPDGLLARSLARVDATRQRPGWLIGEGSSGTSRVFRPGIVPAWAIVLIVVLAAVALVAVGARLVLLPAPAILADLSPSPTLARATPAPSVEPSSAAGPLGGRLILAHTFKRFGDPDPHDVLAIDAGTSERTLLGTLPGAANGGPSGAYVFQRSQNDSHVLLDATYGTPSDATLGTLTDAGRAFGFITPTDLKLEDANYDGLLLSPLGDRIAALHTTSFDVPTEVVIFDLSGTAIQRLPVPSGMSWSRLDSWTPDESAVLASGCRPCNTAQTPLEKQTSDHGHLYVIPLDGSPWRELLDANNGDVSGQWLSDGRTLVTNTSTCASGSYEPRCDPATGTNVLGTIRVADGMTTDLVRASGFFEFKVSPDGQRVVYRTNDGLYVASVGGGTPLKITDSVEPDLAFNAGWSPDGQWLLFERDPAELWIVRSSGGTPRLIGSDLAGASW